MRLGREGWQTLSSSAANTLVLLTTLVKGLWLALPGCPLWAWPLTKSQETLLTK